MVKYLFLSLYSVTSTLFDGVQRGLPVAPSTVWQGWRPPDNSPSPASASLSIEPLLSLWVQGNKRSSWAAIPLQGSATDGRQLFEEVAVVAVGAAFGLGEAVDVGASVSVVAAGADVDVDAAVEVGVAVDAEACGATLTPR